jgi:hypothetical protein
LNVILRVPCTGARPRACVNEKRKEESNHNLCIAYMKSLEKILKQIKGEEWYRAYLSIVDILFFVCCGNKIEMDVANLRHIFSDQAPINGSLGEVKSMFSKLRFALQCLSRK